MNVRVRLNGKMVGNPRSESSKEVRPPSTNLDISTITIVVPEVLARNRTQNGPH